MDLSNIQPVLDWLTLHQHWVALALVLAAFLESVAVVGVIIPGVVLLFGISAIAGGGALNIWPTLACAFVGAVLGDCISFFCGKALKERTRAIWPFRKYPHWINNAEDFISRHGGKSVVIGRFVGPVRPVIPLVVGMLDMSAPRFVAINLLSALAWAPVYILPGFVFGLSLRQGAQFPAEFSALLVTLLFMVGIGMITAKLGHWHLTPDSRLYQFLQQWVERQRNVRLLWYWAAERHAERVAFPLPFLTLLLSCFIATWILILASLQSALLEPLNQFTANFFLALQHPLLSNFFAKINALAKVGPVYVFLFVLAVWLGFKRHISASYHCILAIILLEGVLTFWLSITSDTLTSLKPSTSIMRVNMICLLIAATIAREIHAGQRWLIYGASVLPLLLVMSAQLYELRSTLSNAVISALMGYILASLIILSFGRHQTRRIVPDLSLWVALGVALIGWIIFANFLG